MRFVLIHRFLVCHLGKAFQYTSVCVFCIVQLKISCLFIVVMVCFFLGGGGVYCCCCVLYILCVLILYLFESSSNV